MSTESIPGATTALRAELVRMTQERDTWQEAAVERAKERDAARNDLAEYKASVEQLTEQLEAARKEREEARALLEVPRVCPQG